LIMQVLDTITELAQVRIYKKNIPNWVIVKKKTKMVFPIGLSSKSGKNKKGIYIYIA
jgi:hypothetical protein